jgi:ribosomal protein S6
MNKYEIMLILDPALTEEVRNSAIGEIKSEITAAGKIEKEDIW